MKESNKLHNFHIPVMGIGYSIDTPIKVAQFGINSVISLVDDDLIEKVRKFYCNLLSLNYAEITTSTLDYRAKRITAYLNLVNNLVKKNFEELKNQIISGKENISKILELLPDVTLKYLNVNIKNILQNNTELKSFFEKIYPGSIDVNIMTKLDKENYFNNEKLPTEYCDAHAALRGFANSELNSSVIFSAGLNPRLYSYIEKFNDFFPDSEGNFKKKVTLKVSDYRSALIQGKFLAKKGIWVSEFRVESGLNCGGHAYISNGSLLGTVLEEFKQNKENLLTELNEIIGSTLKQIGKPIPQNKLKFIITAQGGVGTSTEHNFILNYYNINSVGWATPFSLVPEVTNVDKQTLNYLKNAKENDLYLSNISPYGIPFNNLRNNTKDIEQQNLINDDKPGAVCIKKYGAFNPYFNNKMMCTGSREYQTKKIKELKALNLDKETYEKEYRNVVEKSCICVGLGTAFLIKNGLPTTNEGSGVSVCPGPNIAYFSKILTLKEMVAHIYGKINVIERTDRPHVFIKELQININYLKEKYKENNLTQKQLDGLKIFKQNLINGVNYYNKLFNEVKIDNENIVKSSLTELNKLFEELNNL